MVENPSPSRWPDYAVLTISRGISAVRSRSWTGGAPGFRACSTCPMWASMRCLAKAPENRFKSADELAKSADALAILVDRGDRPWDNPSRRPSHADRRRRIAREMLRQEFLDDLPTNAEARKFRDQFERLLSLAI